MIGILIATKAEARSFLKYLTPLKKDGVYHYRGNIAGVSAALYLTRPGVSSPATLRRFLKLYAYDRIISTGACASLTSELPRLGIARIAEVAAPGKPNLVVAHGVLPEQTTGDLAYRRAVSVTHLVTDDNTKADLRTQTGAATLDMESYTIAKIMAEKEFARLPFSIVRVVDDLPGEESYLLKEKAMREITLRTPSGKLPPGEIWRFGMWDYFYIWYRRRALARQIFAAYLKIA